MTTSDPTLTANGNFKSVATVDNPIQMHQILSKLLIPRKLRDKIVSATKHMKSPQEARFRKSLVNSDYFDPATKGIANSAREQGYAIFAPGYFLGADAALAACSDIFVSYKHDAHNRSREHFKADFLVSVASGEAFLDHTPVMDFVLSSKVLQFATEYFGELPTLGSINLMWSPSNVTMKESQLFHRDGEDKTQLKLFLNINDVKAESGPLTLLSAPVSENAMRKLGYNTGRLSDEAVAAAAGPENIFACTGPSGQLAAVDTSRCLHFGSRNNKLERLVLFIQFVRFLAPKQGAVCLSDAVQTYLGKLRPEQRRVLNYY